MLRLILVGFVFGMIALPVSPGFAQDCDDPTPEQMMAGQQKAMAIMEPGPEHKLLENLVGEWTSTVNLYMPGADAIQSPMTSTNELILGGRFLQSTSKGTLMGMPVESVTIFGYDRRHQEYTMVGFDTMGTYSISATGQYDEATRILTLNGTDDDPVLGVVQDYTFELAFNDDGGANFSLTFNCPTMGTGAPFKMMEYTWVKAE